MVIALTAAVIALLSRPMNRLRKQPSSFSATAAPVPWVNVILLAFLAAVVAAVALGFTCWWAFG